MKNEFKTRRGQKLRRGFKRMFCTASIAAKRASHPVFFWKPFWLLSIYMKTFRKLCQFLCFVACRWPWWLVKLTKILVNQTKGVANPKIWSKSERFSSKNDANDKIYVVKDSMYTEDNYVIHNVPYLEL